MGLVGAAATVVAAAVVAAVYAAPLTPGYTLDASWKPKFQAGGNTYSGVAIAARTSGNPLLFVTQRGNLSVAPVVVVDAFTGDFVTSWGTSEISHGGKSDQWGDHGVAVEECLYECGDAQGVNGAAKVRVWIEDFNNHTVTSYTAGGKKLLAVGTDGTAGNGTSPLQFGNVADAVVISGVEETGGKFGSTQVYATDGDGGYANRVVKFSVPQNATGYNFEWTTPHIFNSPHSITLHTRSEMLIIADRGHNSIRLLSADTGEDLGIWDCGLDFGEQGVPFGVRTLKYEGMDAVLIASMDNPQDHKYQRITIVDASGLNAKDGGKSKCSVLQTISIDPNTYSGPHLLTVDETTGCIYAALVADEPLSTVLRFTCPTCKC